MSGSASAPTLTATEKRKKSQERNASCLAFVNAVSKACSGDCFSELSKCKLLTLAIESKCEDSILEIVKHTTFLQAAKPTVMFHVSEKAKTELWGGNYCKVGMLAFIVCKSSDLLLQPDFLSRLHASLKRKFLFFEICEAIEHTNHSIFSKSVKFTLIDYLASRLCEGGLLNSFTYFPFSFGKTFDKTAGYFAGSKLLQCTVWRSGEAVYSRTLDCEVKYMYHMQMNDLSVFWPSVFLRTSPRLITSKVFTNLFFGTSESITKIEMVNYWVTDDKAVSAWENFKIYIPFREMPSLEEMDIETTAISTLPYATTAIAMYKVCIATVILTDLFTLLTKRVGSSSTQDSMRFSLDAEVLKTFSSVFSFLLGHMFAIVPWTLKLKDCDSYRINMCILKFARTMRTGIYTYKKAVHALLTSAAITCTSMTNIKDKVNLKRSLNEKIYSEIRECLPSRTSDGSEWTAHLAFLLEQNIVVLENGHCRSVRPCEVFAHITEKTDATDALDAAYLVNGRVFKEEFTCASYFENLRREQADAVVETGCYKRSDWYKNKKLTDGAIDLDPDPQASDCIKTENKKHNEDVEEGEIKEKTSFVDLDEFEIPFMGCSAFRGARQRYVFKKGDLGLGYYLDEKPTHPKQPEQLDDGVEEEEEVVEVQEEEEEEDDDEVLKTLTFSTCFFGIHKVGSGEIFLCEKKRVFQIRPFSDQELFVLHGKRCSAPLSIPIDEMHRILVCENQNVLTKQALDKMETNSQNTKMHRQRVAIEYGEGPFPPMLCLQGPFPITNLEKHDMKLYDHTSNDSRSTLGRILIELIDEKTVRSLSSKIFAVFGLTPLSNQRHERIPFIVERHTALEAHHQSRRREDCDSVLDEINSGTRHKTNKRSVADVHGSSETARRSAARSAR